VRAPSARGERNDRLDQLAGIRVGSERVRELAAVLDEPTASPLERASEGDRVLAFSIDDRDV
jgi:hypothetical protein